MNWENQSEAECASGMDAALKAAKTQLPPVRSEPLLAPALQRVWDDLVCMCRQGGYASINVASVTRRKAIIAVDEILRANSVISLKTEAYQRGNNKETP